MVQAVRFLGPFLLARELEGSRFALKL